MALLYFALRFISQGPSRAHEAVALDNRGRIIRIDWAVDLIKMCQREVRSRAVQIEHLKVACTDLIRHLQGDAAGTESTGEPGRSTPQRPRMDHDLLPHDTFNAGRAAARHGLNDAKRCSRPGEM